MEKLLEYFIKDLANIILEYAQFAGVLKYTLRGHFDRIICLKELSNGDLVSGSRDNTIKIWSENKNNSKEKKICIDTLIASEDYYMFVCLDTCNDDIISVSNSTNSGVFTKNMSIIKTWRRFNGPVKRTHSNNNKTLRSRSYKIVNIIKDNSHIRLIAYLDNGDFVTSSFCLLKRWHNNKVISTINTYSINFKLFPNGDILNSGYDSSIILFRNNDTATTLYFNNDENLFEYGANKLAILLNNDIATGSDYSNIIKIWRNNICIKELQSSDRVSELVAFDNYLISRSWDNSINVWKNYICIMTINTKKIFGAIKGLANNSLAVVDKYNNILIYS